MNDHEFNLEARAWLDDGPTRLSDQALSSALEEIHATRQRHVLWPKARAPRVTRFAALGAVAALVVAVGLLAVSVAPRQPDGTSIGGPSTPSPSPDPTPSPSPSTAPARVLDFPALTQTFVSPRNGFSVGHPEGAALTPATQLWGFGQDFDIVDTGRSAVFKGSSMKVWEGDGSDEWIDTTIQDYGACGIPRAQQAEITIDGQPGRIAACPNQVEATVLTGGRLYFFTLSHERDDARAIFDAFAATIDLTPETAVNYPSLTSTFVSPVNGFSFGYLDRGGLQPATVRWDPASETPVSGTDGSVAQPSDRGFDLVETGLGAFFKAASVDIPAGVAIDDWIDATLASRASTPTCMVPRSQQAEIVVDGQPGRISEGCAHQFIATVVVDGRLDVFILLYGDEDGDGRAYFDSWLATIRLHPEDAAQPSGTPSP